MSKKIYLYAFFMWTLVAIFYFYEYLIQVLPNILALDLLKHFHISALQLGSFGSAYFLTYVIVQIPAGILLDKLGVRYSLFLAITFCIIGVLGFAMANYYTSALLARALTGLGSGFAFLATMKIAADWLPAKFFPLFAAATLAVGTLGASFGNLVLDQLQRHMAWQSILIIFAVVGLILLLLVIAFIFDPNQKRSSFLSSSRKTIHSFGETLKQLMLIIKQTDNWLAALYMAFFYAPVSTFGTMWGHSYMLAKYPHETAASAKVSALLFLGMTIGSPLMGILSQFVFSFYKLIIVGGLLALASLTLGLYGPQSLQTTAWLIFAYGIFLSSFSPIYVIIAQENNIEYKATSIAFLNMMSMLLGGIVFQPLIGALLDMLGNGAVQNGVKIFGVMDYEKAMLLLPCSVLIALICVSVLCYRQRQRTLT